MKGLNILKRTLLIGLVFVGLYGCDMNTPMNYYIDPDQPKVIKDVENNLNGAYNQFGGYRFYGRNVVAFSDIITDVSNASPEKGHFVTISDWTFSDTEGILDEIWFSGYVVIGATTDVINDAKTLLADQNISDANKLKLQSFLMQAYGLKALSYYSLVNIFGKDVATNGSSLGVILVKDVKPVAGEKLTRATVSETYAYILELLQAGHQAAAAAKDGANTSAVGITPTGLHAIEARVKLSMHDYAGAKAAAEKALATYKGISDEDYIAMWRSVSTSPEDIFTIKKSDDDNLSANALNTLYGSYLATIDQGVVNLVKDTDIRKQLIQLTGLTDAQRAPHPKKYDGTPTAAAVSNIPVLRYSEMYLIKAEAEANQGNLTEGAKSLFNVAKRDKALDEASFTFATKEALLKAIEEERIREFFAEGHRLNDLRRTRATATINGDPTYVIANIAFPIPAAEINAGDMTQQNDDWSKLLPKKPN